MQYQGREVVSIRAPRKGEEFVTESGEIADASHDWSGSSVRPILKADYEGEQAKWIKENDVRVGDTVEIVENWKSGERGFHMPMGDVKVGCVWEIERIDKDQIFADYFLPYFALKKVAPIDPHASHKPFSSREELLPFADMWLKEKHEDEWSKIGSISALSIFIEGSYYTFEAAFEHFEFAQTGEPFGVRCESNDIKQ